MYIEHPKPYLPAGFEKLTVGTSATGYTLTIPSGARHAVAKVRTQPIRWRDDGVAPTSTTGMYAAADEDITLTSRESLAGFRAIAATATTGYIELSYYKL
jgi:hypothetical protein